MRCIELGQANRPLNRCRLHFFSLTRRAAPTIRRCCGLQTKQCSWLSDHAILRPGRGTDVDRCDATSLAILLPTPYTWCDRGFSLCSRPQSTSTGGSRTHFLQTDATLSHSMRRPSSTISRRGYPFSAILTSPPERRVDAICRSCLLSRPLPGVDPPPRRARHRLSTNAERNRRHVKRMLILGCLA